MDCSVTDIFQPKKDEVSYFGKIILGFYCLELASSLVTPLFDNLYLVFTLYLNFTAWSWATKLFLMFEMTTPESSKKLTFRPLKLSLKFTKYA